MDGWPEVSALFAQVTLGGVFLVAAWAKLRNFPLFTNGLAQGFPAAYARAIASTIVMLEMLLAAALLSQTYPRAASWLALFVLLIFTAFLGASVLRKSPLPCNCFGAGEGRAVNKLDIIRNVCLSAVALFAVLFSPPHGRLMLSRFLVSVVVDFRDHPANMVLFGAIAAQIWLSRGRKPQAERSVVTAPTRSYSTRNGSHVELTTPAGDLITFSEIVSRHEQTLLIFVGSGCRDCQRLIRRMEQQIRDCAALAFIVYGARQTGDYANLANAFADINGHLARSFGIFRTPSSVMVDRDGRVVSGINVGPTDVFNHIDAFIRVYERGDALSSLHLEQFDELHTDAVARSRPAANEFGRSFG